MELVGGLLNGVLLENLMATKMGGCTRVRAAVAYADGKNLKLLEWCKRNGVPLEFFGRYDHTVPVSPLLLAWFLAERSPNLRCGLVPDFFHAKVIWWVEAGAYIGSANLTDRAWLTNIEAGTFLTDEELRHFGLDEKLSIFFDQVQERASPLTKEIYDEQLLLQRNRRAVDVEDERTRREFEKTRLVRSIPNPAAGDQRSTEAKRKARFADEWTNTLQTMRDIAQRVSTDKYRPAWVRADVPATVQADQFLHAYYYREVKQGNQYPVEEYFQKNKLDPEAALVDAMEWWKKSEFDFVDEERHLHAWAPRVRELCARDKLLTLSLEEFEDLISKIHAVRDHASKLEPSLIDVQPGAGMDARISALARWLWNRTSVRGATILEMFHYVVWGRNGHDVEPITDRLWSGHGGDEWGIPHIGLSTLGELVGWARPEKFPPRNGRTSKALHALGFAGVRVDL